MKMQGSQPYQLAVQRLQDHNLKLEKQANECHLELQKQIRQERLLAMTALRILHSLNPEQTLNKTVAEVRQLLEIERVLIYRFNPDWSGVAIAESVDDDLPALIGRTIHDHCFADQWVEPYKNGRIQVTADIYDAGLSPCHIEMLAAFQIRANLVVPILMKVPKTLASERIQRLAAETIEMPRLWGLFVAQHCSAARQWQPLDLEFCKKLATQVALAIQQAELYQQAQVELVERQQAEATIRRLNSDLEQRVIQRTAELKAANHVLRQEIAARKRVECFLFQEKELAQVTLKSIGDAVITTDALGNVKYLNPVAEQLTGWKTDEAEGLPSGDVLNIVNEVTRQPVDSPILRALQTGTIVGLADDTILIARDGTEFPIEDSAAPIRARNGEMLGAVLVFHDVTHTRHLTHQLSLQANQDALTGLANRRAFEQHLREAIASARTDKQHHALCYLDLDQFKVVNDACGHIAGDELLCQVTRLLQQQVRMTDTLARLGGDEFGLLLSQCSLLKAQAITDALREIIENFRFTWQGKIFRIGVSIGLVEINADTQSLTSVLSAADLACYAAKDKGRNCVHLYQANDREMTRQRSERQWISRIHQALADNRFRLYYQKILPLRSNSAVEHYEVLLRLIDETGAMIPPMAFIPAAERYDLMPMIDQWVVHTFLANYAQHCQQGLIDSANRHQTVYTLNLSGASINNPQFLQFFETELAQYQVPTRSLCFEITETVAIANLNQAARLIQSLKQLGCSFALDDFGSGMSSLTYLKNLPVDYLKIDGSFVKNIVENSVDCTTVEYFNRISHMMGIRTIAEFVENEAILNKLREMGIDYAQGYGIAKPCPLSFG